MNKALFLISVPAALIVGSFGAFVWGYRVSVPAGLAVLGAAGVALLRQRRKDRRLASRSS